MEYIDNNCEINVEIAGIETKIQFETQCSMIDGKMGGLLQGDTGAFCHFCTSTRSDANDMQYIEKGFHINKNYESCRRAWEKLESGEIAYSSNFSQALLQLS